MPNPYIQVARTYLQRPFCSLQRSLLISGILFLFVLLFFDSGSSGKHEFPPVFLFPFIVLFHYWAIHVKGQFADARASLTPGFRKVHGVVATIAAIVFVILFPGVVAPLIGWQSLGFVSISTFLFGVILWFILRPSFTFVLLMVAGLIFIAQKPIFNGIEQIFCGKEPIQAFIIISTGVILSITGIIRLFLLNEEIPEYHLNIKKTKDGRTVLSVRQWQKLEKSYSQGWRRWFANRTVVRMIYHAQHATDSYWSRMHRWNYSGLSVWFALFFATYMFLNYKLMDFWNGTNSPSSIRIGIATIMPVIIVIIQIVVNGRFMAQDLMKPVRRDSYLKELGICLAFNQFIAWIVIIAVSIVEIFTKAEKPSPEFLIYSISYSLMMQIWLFGLVVWISSFRSIIMSFLLIIAVIFSAINIAALERQMMIPWRPLIMQFGCLLAAIGLLLTWWGYRRWLVADLN